MTLQNRVDPYGEIVATDLRGSLMGNRGGRLHDPASQTLGQRRFATRQWISCQLQFKDRQRQVMGNGYTELFFVDEVTAQAAGHRPCFECRRSAALAFFSCHQQAFKLPRRLKAAEFDKLLHLERCAQNQIEVSPAELVDGAMVSFDGQPWAKQGKVLRAWSFAGYGAEIAADEISVAKLLTPPIIVAILKAGYQPMWHSTAANKKELT